MAEAATNSPAYWLDWIGMSAGNVGRTAALIRSFSRLQNGWHYGRGVPAPWQVVAAALMMRAHLLALGSEEIEAFPRVDGGIVITGFYDKDVAHVTCRPDGRFNLYVERDGEEVIDRDQRSLSSAMGSLRELAWKGTRSSGASTPGITLGGSTALIVKPSKHPRTDFQLLMRRAREEPVVLNVVTYRGSTPPSPAIHQYSFGYAWIASPNTHVFPTTQMAMTATG